MSVHIETGDIEISKALALAIGWPLSHLDEYNGAVYCRTHPATLSNFAQHKLFSYRDPLVIWPIAERYGVFPSEFVTGDFNKHKRQGYPDIESWELFYTDYKCSTLERARYIHVRADTAAKAVALAVIGMLS